MMKFSVLMSVYFKENPKYLSEAIESVLNQTVMPSEIVIVKDGKLSGDLDHVINNYIEKYKNLFKIIELKENQGLGVALEKGIIACSYEIIARMDTDDISKNDRFEKQLKIMEEKSLDIVGSNISEFDGEEENIISQRLVPETLEEIKKFSKRRNPFNHMTVMYKKESILNAGNYKEFLWFEDYNLWVRALLKGANCYNIQENLVNARTGREMFSRRGGIKYIKQEIKMQKFMVKNKYISLYTYCTNILERIFIRVLPNKIRETIYLIFLREN